jgi:hypothetical protein
MIKRSVAYLFLLLFIPAGMQAQHVLSGVVFDSNNRQPVFNANVYLEGTTCYTATDAGGKFELRPDNAIPAQLVISHIAYQTLLISDPFRFLPDTLMVEEKSFLIGEVIVEGGHEKYSRQQKLKAFRRQFLGNSPASKRCTILNEDKIHITFDPKEHILSASSSEPILIENGYSGYLLHLELNRFEINYKYESLNPAHITRTYYEVSVFFEDMAPEDKRIQKRRESIFNGSSIHFLRTLATEETSVRSRYVLHNENTSAERYALNPKDCFTVTDSPPYRKAQIKEAARNITEDTYFGKNYVSRLQIVYGKNVSYAFFFTEEFLIDKYGNLAGFENIIFTGHMGNQRIADLLPVNYGITRFMPPTSTFSTSSFSFQPALK